MARSRVKRATKKKPLNIPSFLPGMRGNARWHVRDTREGEIPHTINLMGQVGEMALPAESTPTNETIKIHELLHAAHSPLEPPRSIIGPDGHIIERGSLEIAEEFRINLMTRVYIKGENLPNDDDEYIEELEYRVNRFVASKNPEDWTKILSWVMIVWPLMSGDFTRLPKKITDKLNFMAYQNNGLNEDPWNYEKRPYLLSIGQILGDIYQRIWKTEIIDLFGETITPPWESVIKLAAFLQDVQNEVNSLMTGSPMPGTAGGGEAASDPNMDPDLEKFSMMHGTPDPDTGKVAGQAPPRSVDLYDRLEKAVARTKEGEEEPQRAVEMGEHKWARMTTRVAELTLRLPKKLVSRSKYRGADEGAVPRFIHRLPVDGKIFGRKKKTPGGSVLIDDSGSMNWSHEEIKAIMEAAPAVNIAAYSADSRKNGELVIIGKDGKYADVSHAANRPKGGDNLVDGPALEWLAGMPKPRIWVSDTYITIVSGDIHEAYKEVFALCKKNDINIVPDAQAAQEVFEGKRVIYR